MSDEKTTQTAVSPGWQEGYNRWHNDAYSDEPSLEDAWKAALAWAHEQTLQPGPEEATPTDNTKTEEKA